VDLVAGLVLNLSFSQSILSCRADLPQPLHPVDAAAALTFVEHNTINTVMSREAAGPTIPEIAIHSPIDGLKFSDLHDSFAEMRNGHRHEAIDIMEPRGTAIHAVADGTIRKLFLSAAGGRTIDEFDSSLTYCYYYAHLDHYAAGIHEGMLVSQGQDIGYVGSTGDVAPDAPHLHFAIYRIGPDKRWWKGTPIDPYPILVRMLKN
jgi:murein DD-endopeptidase MepM/ murein hydrolase activator NlpD